MPAAPRENEIGRARCPVCKSTKARLRVNAKQLAYIVCDACNCQIFARSERSDEHLRQTHVPDTEQTAATAPAPAPARTTPAPAAARDFTPTEPPADKPRNAWGAFPWLT